MGYLMKGVTCWLIIVLSYGVAFSSPANESAERSLWVLRVELPKMVAEFKALTEWVKWCKYEKELQVPLDAPCAAVFVEQKKLEESDYILHIRSAINLLKSEPDTRVNREHMRYFQAAMLEIESAVQNAIALSDVAEGE